MPSFLLKIVFLLLLQIGHLAMAQVKFSAALTPSTINRDEFAQLRLTLENAKSVQEITPPVMKDFFVLSGPNQESGMSMVNGDITRYVAVSFIIKPKKSGKFVLPPALALADGSTYHSNPVNLQVINAIAGNNSSNGSNLFSPFSGPDPFPPQPVEIPYDEYILKKGENAEEKIKRNIIVKLETDKKSCYVGEPIIATYKLYTRLKSESNMTKNPSFNGFSVIDLQQPDNSGYQTEKINGRTYNVYLLRKAQLYPLLPGKLELETAEIENNVSFIREDYFKKQQASSEDPFRDLSPSATTPEGVVIQKTTLQNEPATILVKPLPEVGKPSNFKGAVGSFTIEAHLSKNNFTTEDVNELKLVIGGSGNLQLVTAPELKWPEGMEGFEPVIKDDLIKSTIPVSGGKIISYPFTASIPGNYELPSISFSFFDPVRGQYHLVSTQPFSITVTKSGNKNLRQTVENKGPGGIFGDDHSGNRWLIITIPAILLLSGLMFWFKKAVKKDNLEQILLDKTDQETGSFSGLETYQSSKDELSVAIEFKSQNDAVNFYPALNNALRNYLSKKLHILPEELNKRTISEKMDAKGVKNEFSLQWQQLLDEIDWQLYTPFSAPEKMQEFYERADGLIQLLNLYKL